MRLFELIRTGYDCIMSNRRGYDYIILTRRGFDLIIFTTRRHDYIILTSRGFNFILFTRRGHDYIISTSRGHDNIKRTKRGHDNIKRPKRGHDDKMSTRRGYNYIKLTRIQHAASLPALYGAREDCVRISFSVFVSAAKMERKIAREFEGKERLVMAECSFGQKREGKFYFMYKKREEKLSSYKR